MKQPTRTYPVGAIVNGARRLSPNELNWQGVRFLDPMGKVFKFEGRYIRAISKESITFFKQLESMGILDALSEQGLTCRFSQIQDIQVDGFDILVEQEASCFILPPDQWTFLQFRDAALCWLDINLRLQNYGIGLNDGHLANFGMFADSKPKWFDLGSIVQLKSHHHGLQEFMNCLLVPIMLMAKDAKLSDLARTIAAKGGLAFEIMTHFGFEHINIPQERTDALLFFKRLVQQLTVRREETLWSGYQNELRVFRTDEALSDPRDIFLMNLIKELQPKSMVDIGCNAGFFSQMALRHGAKVFAFDLDEESLEKFYNLLKNSNENLPVVLGVGSALTKNKSEENQCDLAIAMALTHHLSLTQKFPFSVIAKTLATYTSKDLITEFMPYGLGGVREPAKGSLPSWYNLNHFAMAFSEFFDSVETVEYSRGVGASPRTMVICRNKKLENA
jgi:hypothetical protein